MLNPPAMADGTGVAADGKPTVWTAAQLRTIDVVGANAAPLIRDEQVVRVSADVDIWDAWPIQDADGMPAALGGGQTLWMALGAPQFPDPDERHSHARIHLILRDGDAWTHLGPALADGFAPGSREWSGSAILAPDRTSLTLFLKDSKSFSMTFFKT